MRFGKAKTDTLEWLDTLTDEQIYKFVQTVTGPTKTVLRAVEENPEIWKGLWSTMRGLWSSMGMAVVQMAMAGDEGAKDETVKKLVLTIVNKLRESERWPRLEALSVRVVQIVQETPDSWTSPSQKDI